MLKNRMMKRPILLVWDGEGIAPSGKWETVLWSSFGIDKKPGTISIPKLIEDQSDSLRLRYLEGIYKLGEKLISGKRIVDSLELRSGLSYWWMIVDLGKNPYKSNRIYDAFKFFALESLSGSLRARRIIFASADKTLIAVCRRWCMNAGISFECWKLKEKADSYTWTKTLKRLFYYALPHPVRAAITLFRYFLDRWSLRQNWASVLRGAEITFVDYLINVDLKGLLNRQFVSEYWTNLLNILKRTGSRVNLLHLFVSHEAIKSSTEAMDVLKSFNKTSKSQQAHFCLDEELSFSVLLGVIIDYVRLAIISIKLSAIKHCFRSSTSNIDLWLLFRENWRNAMHGKVAIKNCLFINLFERKLLRFPRQKLGIYLQENQAWEMAFIHLWKAAGHGVLIGVPHTTVRYWDMRYFFDSRSYVRKGKNNLPMPDKVAVNGTAAVNAYRNCGYPEDQISEVEALRYLYLNRSNQQIGEKVNCRDALRVLICGDMLRSANQQMLCWLELANKNILRNISYTVKPHPACVIKESDHPSLKIRISNAPMAKLLGECDVAFTSNMTSAAVDAYCTGVPVVSVLDGNTFNMSPLRGLEPVTYVTNADELADALERAPGHHRVVKRQYFCLEEELPRWRRLLRIES